MLGNDEQQQKLLQLDNCLVYDKIDHTNNITYDCFDKNEDYKREEAMRNERLSHPMKIDTLTNLRMNDDVKQKTDCELCKRLQDDQRYLLNYILNTLEIIKKDMRQVNAKLDNVEIEPQENYCCWWPFIQNSESML